MLIILVILSLFIFFRYIFFKCNDEVNHEHFISSPPSTPPILTKLLEDPQKTSEILKSVLGTKGDLGKYDLRNADNAANVRDLLKKASPAPIDMNSLKIPLPPKQTIVKPPEKPKSKKVKTRKQKIHKEESKPITIRNRIQQDYCKFVATETDNSKCPANYPVFTGAKFSGSGATINCGDNVPEINKAEAVAMLYNKKLSKVIVISGGSGYTTPPLVRVEGNGKNAVCKAAVKDGKVVNIDIIHKGSGYTSTPKIKINKPNINLHCKLCCKSEL